MEFSRGDFEGGHIGQIEARSENKVWNGEIRIKKTDADLFSKTFLNYTVVFQRYRIAQLNHGIFFRQRFLHRFLTQNLDEQSFNYIRQSRHLFICVNFSPDAVWHILRRLKPSSTCRLS